MKITSQRYEEIKRTIANLLEDYNVRRLPIDVFDLAVKMKIKIVFASKLIKKHPYKIDEYFLNKYPPSFLYYDPIAQKFIVYIDDINTTKKRQRFSLAHEIVHIILGHREQNETNEIEANFGATYLLAPTSLVLVQRNDTSLLTIGYVSKIFNVSEPEAAIVARYNNNRLTCSNLNEASYERTINNLLKESLIKSIKRYC